MSHHLDFWSHLAGPSARFWPPCDRLTRLRGPIEPPSPRLGLVAPRADSFQCRRRGLEAHSDRRTSCRVCVRRFSSPCLSRSGRMARRDCRRRRTARREPGGPTRRRRTAGGVVLQIDTRVRRSGPDRQARGAVAGGAPAGARYRLRPALREGMWKFGGVAVGHKTGAASGAGERVAPRRHGCPQKLNQRHDRAE